jgi:hypothetical protein
MKLPEAEIEQCLRDLDSVSVAAPNIGREFDPKFGLSLGTPGSTKASTADERGATRLVTDGQLIVQSRLLHGPSHERLDQVTQVIGFSLLWPVKSRVSRVAVIGNKGGGILRRELPQ